ncbi:hypothetical protein Bca101_086797 [Brassica carinata]
MRETRRHSVDVPITRTLVALRRVRSLRDPCTNSMSKVASLLENVQWETGSNNVGLIPFESYSLMEELQNGCDLHKLSKRVIDTEGDACSTKLASSLGDYGSHIGSPMTSTNHSYNDEDVNFENECNRGCGISSCWSRTPKYRGSSNQYSDVEEHHHLLSSNNESNAVTPRSHETVTSRSLTQKFKPKSFDELIGQEVVAKRLLTTVLRGRITSLNLFHGPRGTGKTSTSKIFAAALNCLSQAPHSTRRPCGLCSECTSYSEIDSVKLNRPSYLRSLIKTASLPPVSSRFKVFIIDECQLLCQETWGTLLNGLENVSQRSIFILVTSELEKLPRNALSRSQKYHFSKVCDVEISRKLVRICEEEGIEFDQEAVDFIASRSDGSLRDAEIMLDQLSLIGKRITTSLAYKLIGVVSDDELLDLLDLALSSDTSNTVIRARELMRSKIDPMQLISQLANVIMDIIAGKCQESSSATRLGFITKHTSEEEIQKLNNALKILSDAEKHLRASKNQTTWLTVALLQLSNTETSSFATNENELCLKSQRNNDVDLSSTSSDCPGDVVKSETEECQEKNDSGVAIAELEFYTPKHVTRAEKSWKMIADSFQSVLGCNVEIRMNLVISACSPPKSAKAAAASLFFGLFSCSRRMLHTSYLTTTRTDYDYATKEQVVTNSLRSCQGNLLRARSVRSSANASSRMSSASDQGDANSALGDKISEDDADVLCWRRTPLGKGQGETQNNKSSRLMGRVLPCTEAG